MSIENTLAERGARYGAFRDHAVIAQNLQDAMRSTEGWARLAPDQKQALSVIADKIARMLNGDGNYIDNWHDIIGYAKLVEDRLQEAVNNSKTAQQLDTAEIFVKYKVAAGGQQAIMSATDFDMLISRTGGMVRIKS